METDRNAPATKGDIIDLSEEVHQALDALKEITKGDIIGLKQETEMLRSEMHHAFDDLQETFRDGQTELLKVFYGYTTSTDLRLKDSESSEANLRLRVAAVEQRLTELERKVNFPDHPAQTQ